ncbi:MAG TPA: acyltransferase family protein [Oleiagrimonas sp.]|nr:acyltransferase family protein [Oleiagrimonas sp.]
MTASSSAHKRRDPWLDNARFILIALVVFGHSLEPLLDTHPWLGDCYRFVYTFHMPAFAFLSGAVSRAHVDGRLLRSVAFRLLWPYLVFQGLYALAAMSPIWPGDGPGSVTTPYWLLWYLLSLACWRVLLPLFAHLRHCFVIAVVVAVLAGCFGDIGYYLSLSRTLVFFPLFLMGWMWALRWRGRSGTWPVRLLAVATLAAVFVAIARIKPDPRWLYGSYGYAALGVDLLPGVAIRLLLLCAAMACTLAFLSLVPRRHKFISGPGSRSLGAYVLQGFVIKFAIGGGLFAIWATWPGGWLTPLLLLGSAVVALILSSGLVQRLLKPVTTPRWLEHRLWQKSVVHAQDTS